MEYLLRSMLFVPAINRRYLDKAVASRADALILDVEDSVLKEHKQEARENIVEYFSAGKFKGRQIFIRLNNHERDDFWLDLETLAFDDLLGYMLPKIRDAADVKKIDRAVADMEVRHGFPRGKFVFAPLIENASAVANANEIALASPRLVALCFGGEDYLDSMRSPYSHLRSALEYPRNVVAVAARAAGLAPVDTPYLDIADKDGFREEERELYKYGYAGCLVLHPDQVGLANEVFSPTAEEIRHAEGVVAAIAAARAEGQMIAMYEGAAIGPPMRKLSKKVLAMRDMIERYAVKPEEN